MIDLLFIFISTIQIFRNTWWNCLARPIIQLPHEDSQVAAGLSQHTYAFGPDGARFDPQWG